MADEIQHDEQEQVKLEKTAESYRAGYYGLQRVLYSMQAIQELADGISDQGLTLSYEGWQGLAGILYMLGRKVDSCMGQMPDPLDFRAPLLPTPRHGGYAQ